MTALEQTEPGMEVRDSLNLTQLAEIWSVLNFDQKHTDLEEDEEMDEGLISSSWPLVILPTVGRLNFWENSLRDNSSSVQSMEEMFKLDSELATILLILLLIDQNTSKQIKSRLKKEKWVDKEWSDGGNTRNQKIVKVSNLTWLFQTKKSQGNGDNHLNIFIDTVSKWWWQKCLWWYDKNGNKCV